MAASRRIRLAWLGGGSLFAVAALGMGHVQAVGGIAHQTHQRHTVITAPVRSLDVQRASGTVHVIGTTDATITIDARIS